MSLDCVYVGNYSAVDYKISDFIIRSYERLAEKAYRAQQEENKKPEKDYGLTSREAQILKLITEGYSNNEIANQLFVSINTTKAHVASILQKLEVDDRLQAALKALKERLV